MLGHDPETIHQHRRRPFGGKDLAPVVENDRWFAVTGPGMLAFLERDQAIFRLQGLFDEPHVVFLIEAING